MSAKLSRYVFKKIGGKIVPIRKELQLASKNISEVAKKALSGEIKPIGKGIDFNVYSAGDDVLKIPKIGRKFREAGKYVSNLFPELNDPVKRAVGMSRILPNYGVPTIEAQSVRLGKKLSGVIQQKITEPQLGKGFFPVVKNTEWVRREAGFLHRSTGLDLDAHIKNVSKHGLIDAALGKLPTKKSITQSTRYIDPVRRTEEFTHPTTTKEILGAIKHETRAHDFITPQAALETSSSKINRAIKSLKKKGYRLKPSGDELKLVSPKERIEIAKSKGIVFRRIGGRIVPIRVKK